MDKTMLTELDSFAAIRTVMDKIVQILCPKAIYLYNHRLNAKGDFTSFKLCVIGEFSDKNAAECVVYNRVESEIPFDILLYTPQEWEGLSANTASFASQIIQTGTVLYG